MNIYRKFLDTHTFFFLVKKKKGKCDQISCPRLLLVSVCPVSHAWQAVFPKMAATLRCPETEVWDLWSFPLNLGGLVTMLGVTPCDF